MKKGFFTKKRVVAGVVILVVALLAAGGVSAVQLWDKINHDQMDLFPQPIPSSPASQTKDAASASSSQSAAPDGTPAPTGTLSPEDQLKSQEDPSILKDTLNVLLIGTDYSDERVTDPHYQQSGKTEWNSDVMIVLAINFKQNKVTMISCQRDTYANIINAPGIYKLNSALSRGGGLNDKGYMNVCKSVQYLLDDQGRIPIDYYIAGSIPSVKELTDMVGGIDFDVSIHFKIDGREYQKGLQHLDGQGVLDYCRVRKTDGSGFIDGPQGDQYRVQRQRAVLMTVFKKLKDDASLFKAPEYLMKMQGKVSTNLNIKQLAAIALWAKDLPIENIKDVTMPGATTAVSPHDPLFKWTFVTVDQSKRVQLIQQVYGITVDPEYKYDTNYAKLLWLYMEGEGWVKSIQDLLVKDAALGAAAKLTPDQVTQINDAIKHTQSVMAAYKSKLFSDSTPVVSNGAVTDLMTAVYLLHNPGYVHGKPEVETVTDDAFYQTGYKVDWGSNIYIPHQNQ